VVLTRLGMNVLAQPLLGLSSGSGSGTLTAAEVSGVIKSAVFKVTPLGLPGHAGLAWLIRRPPSACFAVRTMGL
jgi:hypothetical protein